MTQVSTASIIQQIICYNQAELALYYFDSQEQHENLKTFVDSHNISKDSHTIYFDPEFEIELKAELSKKYKEIKTGLTNKLEKILSQNFSYLLNHFRSRSKYLPRISTKVFIENEIYTLFRDRYVYTSESKTAPISNYQDTVCEEIVKGAKFYLNNDIPESAKKDNYKNARLILERVKKYKQPHYLTRIIHRLTDTSDEEWIKCWRDINLREEHESGFKPCPPELCYKSTLVIPMSLSMESIKKGNKDTQNTDKTSNFIDFFKIDETKDQVILGFTCMDHIHQNYFRSIDVRLGYIVSDLLFLYLLQHSKCTSHSHTIVKIDKYLNKK